MTFRRVMLVLLPLLGAIFVFMAFRYWYRWMDASWSVEGVGTERQRLEEPEDREGLDVGDGLRIEVTTNLHIVRKDRQGRPEMAFLADRVEEREGNIADITRPRIQFYTRQGEVMTLVADQAQVVTTGPLTDVEHIKSGRMWGNVVLSHDSGSRDDPTDDLLVGVEDLQFSNKGYELTTDGPVILVAPEMLLTARKMRMVLDRETRRINTLTLLEDILISMEAGRRLQIGLGPVAESEAVEEPAEVPPPPPKPASADRAPAGPGKAPEDEEDGGSLWRIDLGGNVDAWQMEQRLRCDRVALYNEAGRSRTPSGAASPGGASPNAADLPAVPPEEQRAPEADAAPPTEPPETEAPPYLRPGALPPLTVVADGPLIITPVGPEEQKALGDKRYEMTATGKPVTVEDARTRIVGAEVNYNLKTGAGRVVGEDAPILLEQPGRMRLTGGRLDFNRSLGTAEVRGKGELYALVATRSLTGAPSGDSAEAAAPEAGKPSTLDASWERGMRLAFYRLPTGEESGMGEIRQAAFSGNAVVVQKDGRLEGDELVIDFFPARKGSGQAIKRLVGHGGVVVKNERGAAAAGRPETVGDITCEDLDITFARTDSGGTDPKELKASGRVAINDPKGKIRAEDLTVTFARTDEGSLEADFLDAYGNVLIERGDLEAEGDHVKRDLGKGVMLLEGKPAMAARGGSRIIGPRIEFRQAEGKATVNGAGRLEIPATTDLRGQPLRSPVPLHIDWSRRMSFEDKRNFAFFDGDVHTKMADSELSCRQMWVHFKDLPQKEGEASDGSAGKTRAGDELGTEGLLGRKGVQRILADKDVSAVERRLDEDGTVRYQMEMVGDNLTYLEENRKAYISSPGRLRILSREDSGAGDSAGKGLVPEDVAAAWDAGVPDGYARTEVAWAEAMAYDGKADRAYFKGNVETTHVGRAAPGGGGSSRREPTTTRIESDDLQIVFSEQAAAETTASPTQEQAPREERMNVEKLMADGGVKIWVDDRRGTGRRLIYTREPQRIRLYRGADQWAHLWQASEREQKFGEVVAGVITYWPATQRVDLVDQRVISGTPE